MRIAFVSTMWAEPWGGSEELWSRTALRLKDGGHEVLASVVHRRNLSPRVTVLGERGIGVTTHQAKPAGRVGRVWRRLTRTAHAEFAAVSAFRPDLVVISEGSIFDGLACMQFCRQAGLPFVIVVQCNTEHWWTDDDRARELAAAYQAARRVCCVSRKNLDLLEGQIGEALPHGLVVRNPYNVSPAKSVAWPGDGPPWNLACVARLEPAAKGQDLLFQVLAQPQWRDRPVKLNLYGAGPAGGLLRSLAGRLGLTQVEFCGHVNDIAAIWQRNHLLVLPSRYEGLPLALVEAMWCGRPAVVTDVGGSAEMCVDGETGFLAAAPAPALLDQALQRAWDRRPEWAALGRAARRRAEALIPTDPVDDFARELLQCAAGAVRRAPRGAPGQ